MQTLSHEYEKKSTEKYVKTQIKKICNKNNGVDSSKLLQSLSEVLKDIYNVFKLTEYELIIKIDRKKNSKDIMDDIRTKAMMLIPNEINIDFVLKFSTISNEIIVRAKR